MAPSAGSPDRPEKPNRPTGWARYERFGWVGWVLLAAMPLSVVWFIIALRNAEMIGGR
jgi:hypothetical protein